jgi:hypothetical protein
MSAQPTPGPAAHWPPVIDPIFGEKLERAKGFEPSTPTLASLGFQLIPVNCRSELEVEKSFKHKLFRIFWGQLTKAS